MKKRASSRTSSKKKTISKNRNTPSCSESLAYRTFINTQVNNKEIREIKHDPKPQNNSTNYKHTYHRSETHYQTPQICQSPFIALDPTPSSHAQKKYGDTILDLPLVFTFADTFYVQSIKAVFRDAVIYGSDWLASVDAGPNKEVRARVKIPMSRRLLSGSILYVTFICKSNVLVEVEYHITMRSENVKQIKSCPFNYSPPGTVNHVPSLLEGNHADDHLYASGTFSNQNGDYTRQAPRKSQLTFRRSKVNSDTLICPFCGSTVDSGYMKYNMFWKCERCGFCEGIE